MKSRWWQKWSEKTRQTSQRARRKGAIPSFVPALEVLEDRLLMATMIWDGGGVTNNWSEAANWQAINGVERAPEAGDLLEFTSTAARKTSVNDFAADTFFDKITFTGTGYNISGNKIILGALGIVDNSATASPTINTVSLPIEFSGTEQVILVSQKSEVLRLTGRLEGNPALRKAGQGTLELAGSNTYKGTTIVADGILRAANSSALGSTEAGTRVLSGATLELKANVGAEAIFLNGRGFNPRGFDFDFDFLGALYFSEQISGPVVAPITLETSATIGVEQSFIEIASSITGGRSLSKNGIGSLILSAGNDQDRTIVNDGELIVRHANALGSAIPNSTTDTLVVGYRERHNVIGGRLVLDGGIEIASEKVSLTQGGILVSRSGDNIWGGQIHFLGFDGSPDNQQFGPQGYGDIDVESGQLTVHGALTEQDSPEHPLLLTKRGSGRLVVTSANTEFTGVVGVTQGVLTLRNSAALGITGGIHVSMGAALELAGGISVSKSLSSGTSGGSVPTRSFLRSLDGNNSWQGTISLGGAHLEASVDAGGTLTLNGTLTSAPSAGALTKSGLGTLVLTAANTYAGLTTVAEGTLRIANSSALGDRTAGTIVVNGATLEVTGGLFIGEAITLHGSGVSNAGALRNVSGNNTSTGVVTLGDTATVAVDANTQLTINAAIMGPGGLTKTDLGTLEFAGTSPNDFEGTMSVMGGTLLLNKSGTTAIKKALAIGDGVGTDIVRLMADEQIANAAAVSLMAMPSAFGQLDLNNKSDQIGSLTFSGGTVMTGTGILGLNGNVTVNSATTSATISGKLDLGKGTRTFSVSDGALTNDLTVFASISGLTGAGIIKTGMGQMRLAGANTYTGSTFVNAGIVEVGTPSALGGGSTGTTVANGATLQINMLGTPTIAESLTLNGAGVRSAGALVNLMGGNTFSSSVFLASDSTINVAAGTSLSFSGVISGVGGFSKIGAGTLRLIGTSANLYQGTTTVRQGTLELGKLDGAGKPFVAVPGALVIGDGTQSGIDKVLLLANEQVAEVGSVTINPTGLFDVNNKRETVGPLTMTGGEINTGTTGTGVLILNADVTTNAHFAPALIKGIICVGQDRTFTVANGTALSDLIISAEVRDGGILKKQGAGTMQLAGNTTNNYTGTIAVNEGTLELNKSAGFAFTGSLVVGDGIGSDLVKLLADNQIPENPLTNRVTVNSSGILDLNGKSDKIGALTMTGGLVTTGTGILTLNGDVTTNAHSAPATITGNLDLGSATRTFDVADGSAAVDLLMSALVNGNVGFTKTGAGTMQLTRNNTYAGMTTIDNGTLLVDGTQSTSPMTVNSLGFLGGRGTVGQITLNGGSINPGGAGSSTGQLTTLGNLTFSSTSKFKVDLNGPVPSGSYDVLSACGEVVNLNNATLELSLNYTPAAGDRIVILQNDGDPSQEANRIIGKFAGLDEGAIITVGGRQFRITYAGGDGNDVELVAL